MLRKTVLICTFTLAALPALAGTPHLDRREAHQQQRIANGIKSGALTPRETVRLERGEARLQHNEVRAKADGVVTARERVALNAEADHMSKRIYRQKHDAQVSH